MNVYIWVDKQIGIYHNADLGLISFSSDGDNWTTIADKNLGATTVYNSGDTLSESNCGKLYERGNNYGFPYTGPTKFSSTNVNAGSYSPSNPYSSDVFITSSSAPIIWDSSYNRNLWGGGNDDSSNNWGLDNIESTKINRRGPCAEGFHIPCGGELDNMLITIADIMGITLEIKGDGHQFFVSQSSPDILNNLLSYLKLGWFGYLLYSSGQLQSDALYLWSSTRGLNNSAGTINSITMTVATNNRYAFGNSNIVSGMGAFIRPFKNAAVQPDDSWTVLYQPS